MNLTAAFIFSFIDLFSTVMINWGCETVVECGFSFLPPSFEEQQPKESSLLDHLGALKTP